MAKIEFMKVTDLEVSTENPRFIQIVIDEASAIIDLIDMNVNRMEQLVKNIINDGFNNSIFVLLKSKDRKILMDGNRRLTALKIIDNPNLIPAGNKFNNLRNMCKNASININDIELIVETWDSEKDDIENMFKRINQLHVDDNSKLEWSTMAQYRFGERIGILIEKWIKTMQYYVKDDEKIDKLLYRKVDIYKRLLNNYGGKTFFKFNENTGQIGLNNDEIIFKYISDYAQKTKGITRISEDDIKKIRLTAIAYANRKIPYDKNENSDKSDKVHPNAEENKNETSEQVTKEENNKNENTMDDIETNSSNVVNAVQNSNIVEQSRPTIFDDPFENKRKQNISNSLYLIDKDFPEYSNLPTKIKDVIRELKIMDLMVYRYGTCFLYRSLMELTAKSYCEKNNGNYVDLHGTYNWILKEEKGNINSEKTKIFHEILNKKEFVYLLNNNIHDILDNASRIAIYDNCKVFNELLKILLAK